MPNKIPVRTVFFLSPFSFLLYFVPLSCPHHFDVKILGVKHMTNNNEIIIYQSEDGLVTPPKWCVQNLHIPLDMVLIHAQINLCKQCTS